MKFKEEMTDLEKFLYERTPQEMYNDLFIKMIYNWKYKHAKPKLSLIARFNAFLHNLASKCRPKKSTAEQS